MNSNNQPILTINNLQVTRGQDFHLSIDKLDLFEGEVLAIIGPNGAGKSTLLLTLTRLLKPLKGTISYKGTDITQIDELAYRRNLALVLQDPLLFDTTVFHNIATGLRFRGLPKAEQSKRIEEWLSRLNIIHLKQRPAGQLSGGQAQRVSIARAMVLEPKLLLLDEPFRALDAPTRSVLIEDLRTLLSKTKTTAIFVTHNQEQALAIGNRVAVILDGKLQQVGSPQSVFSAPIDSKIASFLGVENVLPGVVRSSESGKILVEVNGHQLEAVGDISPGREVFFCLRPEDITIWKNPDIPTSSARNQISGIVDSIVNQGHLLQVRIDCGFPLVVLITRASAQDLEIEVGTRVSALFKASAVHLIPR